MSQSNLSAPIDLESTSHYDECQVKGCGVKNDNRAMCFKGLPYCSDNHRKILEKENENA